MTRTVRFRTSTSFIASALALFSATTVSAASLERVDDWGADGVPATVNMYLYVPDTVAVSAPVLVLAHYCGGSASAVFGQARGGGLVAAADQYGFIMVVPQASNADGSGRCWDVGSSAALTRNGGGDTEAIAQMVEYTLQEFDANPDRVYVTGDSSGGMMTQALLALYPDVFKAGSALAGVPAGCWAASNPGGGWSGPCAGGTVSHTPEEWGDIARGMYSEYTGQRPRVQLFHGDADDIIDSRNHLEAIKQWTNVLGLGEAPTSTDTVTLGSHQGTRQRWEDDCGYVALDAFTSLGGDHGPSDALFLAEYLVPFFGLNDTGAVDPQLSQCGDSASGGTGGMGAGGIGAGGTGGMADGGSGGAGGSAGGSASVGGTQSSGGGAPSTGGVSGAVDNPNDAAPSTSSNSSGGCSVTGGVRSTFSPWLVLVSLLLLGARRVTASWPRFRRWGS